MQRDLEKVDFDLGENLGNIHGSYMLPRAPIQSLGFLFTDAAKKSEKIPQKLDVYAIVIQIDAIARNGHNSSNNQAPEYFIQPKLNSKVHYFIKKPSIDEVLYYSTTEVERKKEYTASHKNLFASAHGPIEREVKRTWSELHNLL